ncbi:MAG: ABC transporter permease [Dehalococcoidia bacterium]|nr:ABC transporter permease [Dehalococcoidia bacterium]
MTSIAVPAPTSSNKLSWVVSDALVMAKRNIIRMSRRPDYVIFSTIQPVMFIVLFNYVFGGAIATGTANYIDFLIPGILIQTVLFGSFNTGVGLAEDLKAGMIDRYKSLPMSRSAVVAGRIIADTLNNAFQIVLMLGVAFLIGFRFHGTPIESLGVPLIALMFSVPFLWVAAAIGVTLKSAEAVQSAGFLWLFPFTFVSSAFVPVETMASWVQVLAENNPVTIVIDAVRGLTYGDPSMSAIWQSVAWSVGLTVVAAALAVDRYRRV